MFEYFALINNTGTSTVPLQKPSESLFPMTSSPLTSLVS